jgi:hypothetical protein
VIEHLPRKCEALSSNPKTTKKKKKKKKSQGLVAHAYNPNDSRGRDQEDCSLKPIWQIVHETLS